MLERLRKLTQSHGALRTGSGLVSGVIALGCGLVCAILVLSLHLPQYLTTPELRQVMTPEILRPVLLVGMLLGGGISLANLLLGRAPWLAAAAFGCVVFAALLGGYKVPTVDVAGHTPYIGLDWFVLDLAGSTLIFIFIEKLFPLRPEQPVFRPEWQTDLQHFFVNHLLVGFVLLATNLLVHRFFGWAVNADFQAAVQSLPFAGELLLLMLTADVIQYATHRAMHEVPFLWRFHAVHHSIKTLDWLAGSRLHVGEVLFMRTLVLAPIYVMGFSREVIDAYIIVIGFQAVLNHANVDIRLGWLRYVLVTPNFHHWHHSQEVEALDRNYAGQFAFIDHLMGTAVQSDRRWPSEYGVRGDYVPQGFWRQLWFPFESRRRS